MKIGDFVSFSVHRKRLASSFNLGYVTRINTKTARVLCFFEAFDGVEDHFGHCWEDLVSLKELEVEPPESIIIPGYTIEGAWQEACRRQKAGVDALRKQANPGHVVAEADYVFDPRAVLLSR